MYVDGARFTGGCRRNVGHGGQHNTFPNQLKIYPAHSIGSSTSIRARKALLPTTTPRHQFAETAYVRQSDRIRADHPSASFAPASYRATPFSVPIVTAFAARLSQGAQDV